MKKPMISVACWLVLSASAAAATVYVDPSATGAGDGSSWANGYTVLNDAISAANAGDEVWVIAGTYTGTTTLKDQVKVYGGFAGTETLASQSAPFVNLTYLSGNGTSRAVDGSGLDSTTVLRGFHIIDGNLTAMEQFGAGMRLTDSDVAIVNCVFAGNSSASLGGGAVVFGGSPTFLNCRFTGNDATLTSGAVGVRNGAAPTFVNCLFDGNTGLEGAGVGSFGSDPTFINCTFAKNATPPAPDGGGGGALTDYTLTSVLKNCVVYENTAAWPDTDSFRSSTTSPGSITATYSDIDVTTVPPLWPGTENINADPTFVDSAGGNFRLLSGSPCLDEGDDIATPLLPADDYDLDWDGDLLESIPLDLGGAPRVQGTYVDMGAYEGIAAVVPDDDPSNPDTGDGSMVRFISLEPVNTGDITALRVTLTNLPSPFTSFNGTTMWVGAPATICHNQTQTSPPCSNPSSGFEASRLRCTPHYMDWSTISTLYIYDDEIVPGAVYDVQAIDQGWDTGHEENYSSSLTINTSVWGDVTGGFDSGTSTWIPPDGSVDMTTDYTAVLDKFSGVPGAPHKARCDLDADVPDRLIGIADIISVLNAFSGLPYPFDGPGGCP